jgi:hypothetical protein
MKPAMQSRTRISLLILLIISLHAVPVVSYQKARQTRWPFLLWAMYAKSYPPGPIVVQRRRVMAASAGGKEEEITAQMVGLPTPAFRNIYVTPLWNGDSALGSELIRRLNDHRDDPVVQLRLEGEQLILADTGTVREPLPTVTYRADPSAPR